MSEWSPEANEIFLKALDCESSESRQAYLDEVCGSDKDLRAQVESLLEADLKAGSFLGRPVAGVRPPEVLDALTNPTCLSDAIDPPPNEISLDFLEPCDASDRLGKLGPYEVIDIVGRGGMGVVLRAHDPKLNRVVAVKALCPEFAANATARKRFLREARAAAAVSHPHVVTIHAVEEAAITPYLVMEYVDGQSLQEKIRRIGTFPVKEILRIGSQIAAGLAAAHHQGLIHRDIKPGNILLENGVERVKITDFGLARAVDDIGMTRTGDVAGTPEFMSPEQAQGHAVNHRSDLFSLGSVLYAMCTGRSPFRADTTIAVLRRVCDDVPRRICEVSPEIPANLIAIIDRLLAKNPDERFQTAEEVADLLAQHLAHIQQPDKAPLDGAKAGADGPPVKTPHGRRRRAFWLVGGLALMTLLASLSITEATGVTRFTASVLRIMTGEGTLVVTVDDPEVSITVEDQDIVITGAGPKEVRLTPGEYRLHANKNGKPVPLDQELATITRGGREVVNVTLVPSAGDRRNAVAWAATLPADAPPIAETPFDSATAKAHQQAWADYLGLPAERELDLPGGERLTLVLIPPGEFLMGSSEEEQARFLEEAKVVKDMRAIEFIPTEGPQHRVQIGRPFYLGKYEVTQAQWEAVVGNNPSTFQAPAGPVENVSWNDANWYAEKLNASSTPGVAPPGTPLEASRMMFTLPTEAQWEYACRAGTSTAFFYGNSGEMLGEYAWHPHTAEKGTHPVGELEPNAWGLYDIHGNVWEWCADWYAPDYHAKSPRIDPVGPDTGSTRIFRGGSYGAYAPACRSAFRRSLSPDYRIRTLGFRLAVVFSDESAR